MWLEQATLLVDEGECSDKEKRQRILESLKGPALEIIQAVRMTEPDASPHDFIEAIESIFGTVESGEELYLSFRALHQQSGERLSDFLRRLERSLVKVLKIRERKDDPPTFLNLLREMIEEESRQSARQSQTAPVRRQHVRTIQAEKEKEPDSTTQRELEAQIQELKARLEKRNNSWSQLPPDDPIGGSKEKEKKKQKIESQSELKSLRKQVEALENKMSVMAVNYTSAPKPKNMTQPSRHKAAQTHKPIPFKMSPSKDFDGYFCYKCGENGHIANRCTSAENPQKVIRKLIRVVRGAPDPTKTNILHVDANMNG
ncbi:modulator of apoptosis 1-like [Amphiprion ocellaris]|uniref:modulator of apoptosis 1-like n=1 Tax=Amphiprion ocellaris TaxID=80972 RepID=UPI00241197BE|nr:modulator of apoptosis 1-like [Amphiprion ocellaris]